MASTLSFPCAPHSHPASDTTGLASRFTPGSEQESDVPEGTQQLPVAKGEKPLNDFLLSTRQFDEGEAKRMIWGQGDREGHRVPTAAHSWHSGSTC